MVKKKKIEIPQEVLNFKNTNGITEDIEYIKTWKEYQVYLPIENSKEILYTGLPLFILFNKEKEVRYADADEISEIL